VQVGARGGRAVGGPDKLHERHILAVAARVPHGQLYFFNRRHGLRNTIVGFFHRGDVRHEKTPALNVPEHELAAECGDAAVIREPVGHRRSLVVVVDGNRVGEAVLLAPVEQLRRQRK